MPPPTALDDPGIELALAVPVLPAHDTLVDLSVAESLVPGEPAVIGPGDGALERLEAAAPSHRL